MIIKDSLPKPVHTSTPQHKPQAFKYSAILRGKPVQYQGKEIRGSALIHYRDGQGNHPVKTLSRLTLADPEQTYGCIVWITAAYLTPPGLG